MVLAVEVVHVAACALVLRVYPLAAPCLLQVHQRAGVLHHKLAARERPGGHHAAALGGEQRHLEAGAPHGVSTVQTGAASHRPPGHAIRRAASSASRGTSSYLQSVVAVLGQPAANLAGALLVQRALGAPVAASDREVVGELAVGVGGGRLGRCSGGGSPTPGGQSTDM